MLNNNESYNKICENLAGYLDKTNADYSEMFDENFTCSLVYTFRGEADEFELQTYIDLKNFKLVKELTKDRTILHREYVEYSGLEEIAEITEELDFDDLETLDEI